MVRWGRAILVGIACFVALGAARHPLHTTITEISYESATRNATIVVRAFEEDVVAAAATKDDGGVLAYVARHVVLTDRGGRIAPVKWESIRRQDALLWMSGRVDLSAGLGGTTVVNRILTERFADQVNVVQAIDGARRQTILFTRGDGPKSLR